MKTFNIFVITNSVVFIFIAVVHSKIDFTNIKCVTDDKTTVYFDKCLLKAVNRTYKYITVIGKFPKPQLLNNIKVNFAILRKENGYKPFLYNITIDGCKYLKNRGSNPVIRFAHSFFEKYSTINKTCPYGDHDVIVDKLPVSHIDHLVTHVLPVPNGDYAYSLTFYLNNKKAAVVTAYATIA